MLRREHEERGAEQRVGPCREDLDVDVEVVDAEQDVRALGTADPVLLDGDRAPRPVERRVVGEQLVGVGSDAEEPLREVAQLDLGAAALAATVHDLLVGEHGLVVGAPVDGRLLPVREPLLQHPQEDPLRPAVVRRLVRRDLARPVDRPAQAAHLAADVGDVALGDLARVPALLDRRVLGGEPERVVAHGAQHRVAVPPPEVGDDVAQRVVEDVPHVEVPGGVREHLEHVELLGLVGGREVVDLEGARVSPDLLPLRLDRLRVVRLQNRYS